MTKRDTKPSIPAVTFSPYLFRRHRQQLGEWVQANGIEPSDVSADHPIRVERGKGGPVICYRSYVLGANGEKLVDPAHPDELVTAEYTAPCTIPPPDLGAAAPRPGAEAGE